MSERLKPASRREAMNIRKEKSGSGTGRHCRIAVPEVSDVPVHS